MLSGCIPENAQVVEAGRPGRFLFHGHLVATAGNPSGACACPADASTDCSGFSEFVTLELDRHEQESWPV